MSPLLQRVLQELAQLSAEEQLEVIAQATEYLKHRASTKSNRQAELALPTVPTADPLVGLFSGSPNLATQSEEILQQEISPESGWSWKA